MQDQRPKNEVELQHRSAADADHRTGRYRCSAVASQQESTRSWMQRNLLLPAVDRGCYSYSHVPLTDTWVGWQTQSKSQVSRHHVLFVSGTSSLHHHCSRRRAASFRMIWTESDMALVCVSGERHPGAAVSLEVEHGQRQLSLLALLGRSLSPITRALSVAVQ